jgi:hypothetical protein
MRTAVSWSALSDSARAFAEFPQKIFQNLLQKIPISKGNFPIFCQNNFQVPRRAKCRPGEETLLPASFRLLRRLDLRAYMLNSGDGILQPNHCSMGHSLPPWSPAAAQSFWSRQSPGQPQIPPSGMHTPVPSSVSVEKSDPKRKVRPNKNRSPHMSSLPLPAVVLRWPVGSAGARDHSLNASANGPPCAKHH